MAKPKAKAKTDPKRKADVDSNGSDTEYTTKVYISSRELELTSEYNLLT